MRTPNQPHGPPMTLGNMRELGVQRLVASCLNDACRHTALIDVSGYSADTEILSFKGRAVCAKCGGRGTRSTCGQTGKEQPTQPSLVGKCSLVGCAQNKNARLIGGGPRNYNRLNGLGPL
jgi:hypothetical protein